jgi:hypothetical protein
LRSSPRIYYYPTSRMNKPKPLRGLLRVLYVELLMVRCLECGCSRFDSRGMGCALCGTSHGPRWERCYITEETQRTLFAHADDLQQFGVTLTENDPLNKDLGTTLSVIRLVLQIADSLDKGVLRKLILYLHEKGISRNEILRLRLSEPEDIDNILDDKR